MALHGLNGPPLRGGIHVREYEHSMYQLQAEYLCDISEFFAPWVPYAAVEYSETLANNILEGRILGAGPGWVCGEPRPL